MRKMTSLVLVCSLLCSLIPFQAIAIDVGDNFSSIDKAMTAEELSRGDKQDDNTEQNDHIYAESGIVLQTIEGEDEQFTFIANGTCGDNLTWSLDEQTGELFIRGNGPMDDYEMGEAPWYDYSGKVTSICVETGITSIGNSAFAHLNSATEVFLPDTLTSIGLDVV